MENRDTTEESHLFKELFILREKIRKDSPITDDQGRFAIIQAILDKSGFPVSFISRNHEIMYMNEAARKIYGVGAEQRDALLCFQCHHRRDLQCSIDTKPCPIVELEQSVEPMTFVHEHYTASDEKRIFEIIAAPIRSADGNFLGVIETSRDITDQKHLEEQLRAMSFTDELTGLYNRRGFFTFGSQQLKIADRLKKHMLMLSIDVDGLKSINDTYGHREGDIALIETADILREVFRESDVIARVGGDEFLVLQMEESPIHTEIILDRLQEKIDFFNAEENPRFTLSLSVGASRYDPLHPCSIEDMRVHADKAMYDMKRKGKS